MRMFLFVVLLSRATFAQTAIYWLESKKDAKPSTSLAFIDQEGWELWSLGLEKPIIEWGKIGSKGLGGYLSLQTEEKLLFLEPYGVWNKEVRKNVEFYGGLGGYIPLNGGKYSAYTSGIGIRKVIGKWKAGLEMTFFAEEGAACAVHSGLRLEKQIGPLKIAGRYLPLGGGPDTARAEANYDF